VIALLATRVDPNTSLMLEDVVDQPIENLVDADNA
jgi:hypothetical protein